MRKKSEPEVSAAVKKALDKGGMVVPKAVFDGLVEEAGIPVIDVVKDNNYPPAPEPAKHCCDQAYADGMDAVRKGYAEVGSQKFEVTATNPQAAADRAGMQQMLHAIETYKSLIFVSVTGFCALLLANLTGVIVSLALYKGVVAVLTFGCGALFALACFFASYWTQSVLFAEDMKRAAPNSHLLWVKSGFIAALASLVFFIGGIIAVVS